MADINKHTGKLLIGLLAGSLLLATPSQASAEEKENPRLQYRQHVMQIVKYSLTGMKAILQGDIKDADQFPALANSMASAASIATDMFEHDTRSLEGKTTAKADVWDNWQDFSKRMNEFNTAAQALAAVAKEGDMKKNIAAFKNTAKNCKACHDEYRIEKK